MLILLSVTSHKCWVRNNVMVVISEKQLYLTLKSAIKMRTFKVYRVTQWEVFWLVVELAGRVRASVRACVWVRERASPALRTCASLALGPTSSCASKVSPGEKTRQRWRIADAEKDGGSKEDGLQPRPPALHSPPPCRACRPSSTWQCSDSPSWSRQSPGELALSKKVRLRAKTTYCMYTWVFIVHKHGGMHPQ